MWSNFLYMEDLKCFLCEKYLTVSPVYSVDELGNICGRCTAHAKQLCPDESKFNRQIIFESVAKHLTFPCSNRNFGCTTCLRWNDVDNHEGGCICKKARCLLNHHDIFEATCNWTGDSMKFVAHVEKDHADLLFAPLELKLFVNVNADQQKPFVRFTRVGPQLIAVVVKYVGEGKYFVLVMLPGTDSDSQCYRYQLELFNDVKDNSIILRKNRLQCIDNFINVFNDENAMSELNIAKFTDMLKFKEYAVVKFGIVRKKKKEINEIQGINLNDITQLHKEIKEEPQPPLDEDLLEELECPICKEYMTSPIFICVSGHSLCSICRPKVEICPTCKSQMHNTRNYALENLSARMNFPCHNREIGCPLVSSLDKIRQHEPNCSLTNNRCFMPNCKWSGAESTQMDHIREGHQDQTIQNNAAYVYDMNGTELKYYFVNYDRLLFQLTLHKLDDSLKYNLSYLDELDENVKYNYVFQLVHGQIPDIIMGLPGLSENYAVDKKAKFPNTGEIPLKEIRQHFMFENQFVYFKINIVQRQRI